MGRFHYYKAPDTAPQELQNKTYPMKLSEVKSLMKKHGGTGATEHWVSGSFEGCTDIQLTSNPTSRKSTHKIGRS